MKNFYLLLFFWFLLFSSAAPAQMPRAIRNNIAVRSGLSIPVNNVVNTVTSCSVDTIILTTQAQINNFATTYPTCINPKYLIIDGTNASPAITSLAGLSSITQVQNKLVIRKTSVTSLSALNGITSIGDTLEVTNNNLMTSLGLTNLTQLGSIKLRVLPLLTSIAGISNNINSTGSITIDSVALTTLSGFSNIDSLTTPNGGLNIIATPITTLSTLTDMKRMTGYLNLYDLTQLTSLNIPNLQQCWGFLLNALPNLTSLGNLTYNLDAVNKNTGTFYFIQTGLFNLSGMDSVVSSANFLIWLNPNLTTLQGLQNLAGANNGGISIWANNLLTNTLALSGITSIQYGTLEFNSNPLLTNANIIGVKNITSIAEGLWINDMQGLTSLNFLDTNLVIQNISNLDSIRIYDNNQLSLCNAKPICTYLNNGGTAFIDNNAAGCNTIAQIITGCGPGINYSDPEDNCCTYNAIPINQGQIKNGNVGHYVGLDGNGDPIFDDYDTYRIIMPYSGAFKLFVTAKNDSSCYENTSTSFNAEVLGENGGNLQYKNLFNWSITDPCHLLKTDTFKFRGYEADTFYVRLQGNKISYSFSWQALDSTSNDEGDNNNITTAFPINPLQIKKGHLKFKTANHDDQNDYYKTVLPVSANIDVYIKITNRENQTPSPSSRFHFDWGYTAAFGNFSNINYPSLPAVDNIIYDTIQICALANDTIFFRLVAPVEAYEYEWSYKIIDTLINDAFEPNNNLATSTPISVSQTRVSTIGYTGKLAKDNEDNFVTVLPQSGIMRIYVQATSNKCDVGYLNLAGLNRQQNYVVTKYISGSISIPTQTTVYDTISICGQPADTFYFKFISTAAFQYQFRYEMIDPIPNAPEDPEPNNTFATSVPINALDSVNGRLRFITLPTPDENDYYRTILPKDGTMNIILKTTNYNCGSNHVNFWVYDRRQGNNFIYFNQFTSQSAQTRYDTIKLCGLASDTFYLRIHSFGKIVYSIKYQLQDTSINDIEPNNSFATAIAYNENEVKKGHIGYYSNGSFDFDYYRTVLPKDGTMKIMVKITNKSCTGGNVYARFYDRRQAIGEIFQKYIANSTNVPAGQTAFDTILFCGRAVDTFYLRYEPGGAFDYEFKYEMIDTSANDIEPNNSFAQALPVNILETKRGHIRYNANGGTDALDYYKTLLPTDGTLKIMSQVTNTSCANGQYVYLRVYDRLQNQILEKFVGGSNVAAGQTVFDTAFICGRASDSIYYRFEATNSFAYQFKYEVIDTSANDIEPNNSFAQATLFGGSQTKKGHIRYNFGGGTDTQDYYKIIFDNTDSLKLQLQATNLSCANGQYVYLRVYNKFQNQILEKYLGSSSVAAGQTVTDNINLLVTAPDTIYVRFEATNPFKYQFSSNPLLPSSGFTITGDTTVCYGTKTYKAINVVDDNVTYNWSLPNGGGTITAVDSIATVTWNANGNRQVQLFLSNAIGNGASKTSNIIVNNNPPTAIPVIINANRNLITNNVPPGTYCQWFKNGVIIIGAIDSSYYAADAGTFAVKFVNPCGIGPASNSILFAAAALAQTITFTHTPNITMSPTAKAKLNASASSGLPVTFVLISGNATVIQDTVYANSVGTIIVRAQQTGDN
ncbi:MAG: hypothetical protein LH615_12865, partial [Ferruginibacter sp.]|nr:hypothetical protein [Ferruginibacter sp.]